MQAEDVLITPRLYGRRSRPADLERELEAHRHLSTLMTIDPVLAIQGFLDLALELCPAAGSAGLSELQTNAEGETIFAWTAMSGALAHHVGGTTPRDFSPCGLCLDSHHTILVDRPARVFTYFEAADPRIFEGLVVPLYDTGKRPLGTLWVVTHSSDAELDATDARVMEQLAVQLVLALKLRKKGVIMAQLEEVARDKDILVQEVRHRVKNMIQMISSLLHLQEKGVQSPEARTALREAQGRLLVLSNVYESLLSPVADVRNVDVGALIEDLMGALRSTSQHGTNVELATQCEAVMFGTPSAVPVGLIVNEAVTNALKHAFLPGEKGHVLVQLSTTGTSCALTIADDGKGFVGTGRTGSLGMNLIRSLARQLGAKLSVDGSAGVTINLEWPLAAAPEVRRETSGSAGAAAAAAVSQT